jgi:diguanylate cyclase (GGDEF)-like protein
MEQTNRNERSDTGPGGRVVVIAEGLDCPALLPLLRRRYPEWVIAPSASYLTGIAEVGRRETHAVLLGIDPTLPNLEGAVAALRESAGSKTRVILCCPPEREPLARRLLPSGADDYIITPPSAAELDGALDIRTSPSTLPWDVENAPSEAELTRLELVLAALHEPLETLLLRIAELVRAAIPTRGVLVETEGKSASVGTPLPESLSLPLMIGGRAAGRIVIGPPVRETYDPAHGNKLEHHARLAGHVLEAVQRNERWRTLACTEELSGLPNRRFYLERLEDILRQAAEHPFHVSVLLFDIDDFKSYNDRFGHGAGDQIIRVIGSLFRAHCRDQDVVARYGGDEFAVIFWDPQGPRVAGSRHPDCALDILTRFQEALRTQRLDGLDALTNRCVESGADPHEHGSLTISGGLATYPWDGASVQELLQHADEALLAAKRAGKSRIYLIGDDLPRPATA